MGFFHVHSRFLKTSQTGASLNRLNRRHEAIFGSFPEIYVGARVLDIASHDGRWSFAALKAGAAHVIGVEPREHLIKNALQNFQEEQVDRSTYQFVQASIFDYLSVTPGCFDIVLCLGFFYHTYRHPELMKLIKQTRPKYLVIDSRVYRGEGMFCEVAKEDISLEAKATDEFSSHAGMTYVAAPTPTLLKDFAVAYGFEPQQIDWEGLIGRGDRDGLSDYAVKERITLICKAV